MSDLIKEFCKRRRDALVSDLLRLYQEGKLTAEKACGIAAGILEIRMLDREFDAKVSEIIARKSVDNEKNIVEHD